MFALFMFYRLESSVLQYKCMNLSDQTNCYVFSSKIFVRFYVIVVLHWALRFITVLDVRGSHSQLMRCDSLPLERKWLHTSTNNIHNTVTFSWFEIFCNIFSLLQCKCLCWFLLLLHCIVERQFIFYTNISKVLGSVRFFKYVFLKRNQDFHFARMH